jgi:ABC-2 type transport system ATP-binding protein
MPGSEKEYKYWGKHADTHDNNVLYIVGHTINKEIKGWLANQFKNTDTVLELGCGTGIYSEMIAGRVKYLTVTDLSQDMIEKTKVKLSQLSNVEVRIADSYNTLFEDSMFDAALLVNILHIVKDPISVLKETHRILKDNGRVVIVDFTGYGMPLLQKLRLGFRYLKTWGSPAPYNKNLSPDKLVEIVKEAGFAVEESKLIGKDTKAVCLRARSS